MGEKAPPQERLIRPLRPDDVDAALQIWLEANLQAHDFIDPVYWTERVELVRALFPQSEMWVCAAGGAVCGFIGITDGDYIAGIFVAEQSRGHGIGKALLNHAKWLHPLLKLHVYRKNDRAVRFYLREGFTRAAEQIDAATGESELLLVWENKV